MTSGASIPTPPLLAVHSVDEFVFSVPDLEAARQFYASFGLDVRDEDGGLALYAFGHPQRWGRIRQAAGRKRLLWLSLGIHAGTRRASPNAWISRASRASPRPPARTMVASGSPVPTACRYSCAPRQVLAVGAGAADPASALRQCRPRPRPQPRAARSAAVPVAHPAVQRRCGAGHALLCGRARPARVGHVRRRDRVPAQPAWQRPSPDRAGQVRRPGPAPHQLVRGLAGRRGPGHGTDERGGPWRGLGRRPPRAGLQLLPLRARPWAATPSIPTTSISSRPARHGPRPTIRPRTRCTSGAGPAPDFITNHEQDG